MAPILPLTALAATLACLAPSSAAAVTVAAGPDRRALVTWGNDLGTQLIERSASGVSPAQTISAPQVLPLLAAWGPGGAATVLAFDQSDTALRKLVALRRGAGAASFAAPQILAQERTLIPGVASANERGDIAIVVQRAFASPLLVTAAAGQAFTAPQELTGTTAGAAVAVGGAGRVVVAYHDYRRRAVYMRAGTAGSQLGAPVRVAAGRPRGSDVAAAVDAAGNATIAFVRSGGRNAGAQLVASRARPGEPFGAPVVVATGGPPQMGAGFGTLKAAAAGSTTALAWGANDDTHYGTIDVAVARGSGRFGSGQRASARALGPSAIHGSAGSPVLAVDRAGDIVIAYSYGYAVHAALRPAGSTRFGPPRVMSTLATAAVLGGEPAVALLSDRRPLVAYHAVAGSVRTRVGLTGGAVDLTSPRAKVVLARDAAAQLRSANALEATVSCSKPCRVEGRATLRTTAGRTTSFGAERRTLRAGATLTQRFEFDPRKRAGRAGDGARARVTISVENASGVSTDKVKELTLGAK